jgi:hypothetical protein
MSHSKRLLFTIFLLVVVMLVYFLIHVKFIGTNITNQPSFTPDTKKEVADTKNTKPLPESEKIPPDVTASTSVLTTPPAQEKIQTSFRAIFSAYGVKSSSIENDLRLLHAAISLWQLADTEEQFFGNNQKITNSLCSSRGESQILDSNHPMISKDGELLDRWGTPISFHDISRRRMDLISAGPDKIMGSGDDVMMLKGNVVTRKEYSEMDVSDLEYPKDRFDSSQQSNH